MLISDIEIFRAALAALEGLPTHKMSFRWAEGRIARLKRGLIDLIEALNNLEPEEKE